MEKLAPVLKLNSGRIIPQVGFGTWKGDNVAAAVYEALKCGYRHIDTACDYGNEKEVGVGIRRAIDEGICKRDDIFVTSKLWNTFHAKEHVEPAIRRTLSDLQLDYLDLYLVHFPISLKFVPFEKRYPPEWIHDPEAPNPKMEVEPVPVSETWAAMEQLAEKGLTRNIGVSNFNAQLTMDLMSYAKIKPAVNQIELHPYLVQPNLVRYCQKIGIHVTAYSPLGAGSYVSLGMTKPEDSVLRDPVIAEIAQAKGKSPAQVVLRWACQRGVSIVPKSSNPKRIAENIQLFDFSLTEEEMAKITGLNKNRRYNDPGVFCEAAFGEFYPIHA